jgi:hypothetical protein
VPFDEVVDVETGNLAVAVLDLERVERREVDRVLLGRALLGESPLRFARRSSTVDRCAVFGFIASFTGARSPRRS